MLLILGTPSWLHFSFLVCTVRSAKLRAGHDYAAKRRWAERPRGDSRGAVDDLQALAFEKFACLAPGVIRPRADRVELDVGGPVAERLASFAGTLIGQREIVVGVSVIRRYANGCWGI